MSQLRTSAAGGEGLSRYVEVQVEASLPELHQALDQLGLHGQARADGRRVMLEGSLECAGQPVDLRFEPGTLDAVEDFGFVVSSGQLQLVCGDVDQAALEAKLLTPLRAILARVRAESATAATDLETELHVEADGTRRIVVRRK